MDILMTYRLKMSPRHESGLGVLEWISSVRMDTEYRVDMECESG